MNVISTTKMVHRETTGTEVKDEDEEIFLSCWTEDDSRSKQEIRKKK